MFSIIAAILRKRVSISTQQIESVGFMTRSASILIYWRNRSIARRIFFSLEESYNQRRKLLRS